MLVPHLIFTHLLTDYVLQTNWVVRMKTKGWPGLILHGGTFWLTSLIVLYRHWDVVFIALTLLSIEHILQDSGKIRITRRFPTNGVAFYFLDQLFHLAGILIVQLIVGSQLDPKPSDFELFLYIFASSFIMVTRFFEITLIANYPSLGGYTKRWALWGYIERTAILLLVGGLGPLAIILALLCPLPRLWKSKQEGQPIWENRSQIIEVAAGFLLSVVLGLGLWKILGYI
ncbi:MAG: DUF3307 domain-containing protein [Anaerolineae bacterium]|nr:DUF3307 domain-containing protein [Anaerolineae bacterium]